MRKLLAVMCAALLLPVMALAENTLPMDFTPGYVA